MNSFESMCETFGSLFRKKSYLLLVKNENNTEKGKVILS
ncbi:unknown [Tannerella sp. CAG:118]|uniref:Uncharacterized protein n=1 Tax=Coprobacter secundus subsp. similis TaxID=2751153 RepID=A0A7G1HZT2_9BACT|nr:hypothetical protein Cop2CBH44_23540 [Coprobacter secundus subsp. similis]CCY38223.1 unknown [Tannerella sp. CAG:118]